MVIDDRHRGNQRHRRHVLSHSILRSTQRGYLGTQPVFEDPVHQTGHFPVILAIHHDQFARLSGRDWRNEENCHG